MLKAETYHPVDLPESDVVAWRALCASRTDFANPLLGPDFALAVGAVRDDARVTVWRWPERVAGFLAHHRRPGGLARPIGAPLSDYHALVAAPGLDAEQALTVAGLAAYRFTGLIDPNHAFGASAVAEHEAYQITLNGSAETYLEALRVESPKRFKNYRRLDHKMDRELGAISVRAPDRDPAAFDQLIAWKRAQLARTGAHDFLRPAWTRALMASLFGRDSGEFQGLMINLYAGERLVAGHFGIRLGGVYHPWIASTDPELGAWSPGQVFLQRAIAVMPELGLTTYDLGPGHDHYKRPYALDTRVISEGAAVSAGSRGLMALASEQAWALAGANRAGLVGSLRRRLDVITATDLSLADRAQGLADALSARARPRVSEAEAA